MTKRVRLYEGNGEEADEETFLAAGYVPAPLWLVFDASMLIRLTPND